MNETRSAADVRVLAHALRAAGQAGAVAAMIRDGAPYEAVVQQLLATRGSFDALLTRLAERELAHSDGADPPDPRVARVLRVAFDRPRVRGGRARGVERPPAG